MTTPATQFETYRPDLADTLLEFSLQADQMGFVGLQIAPVLEVSQVGGVFGKIELKEMLQARDTLRAPDGSYNQVTGKGTKDSYLCDEHGLEERVDERESTMFADFWDAEQLAAERTRDAVVRNHNARVIALALAVSGTTAAGTVWSSASADPVANVRSAKIAVRNRTGVAPNALVLDWEAFEYLLDSPAIVDRIKFSGRDDPKRGNIPVDAVAAALGLQYLEISGGVKNIANQAQPVEIASMWDRTQAFLYVRSEGNDLKRPQFARTFHWGADGSQIGGTFESYYDHTRRSDIIRHRMDTDEKVVYAECGQRITGILS